MGLREIASGLAPLAKTGGGCDCFGTFVPRKDRRERCLAKTDEG